MVGEASAVVWMTVGYKDAAEIVGTPANLPGRFQDGLGAARSTGIDQDQLPGVVDHKGVHGSHRYGIDAGYYLLDDRGDFSSRFDDNLAYNVVPLRDHFKE
jgi:hypothetical protein